MFCPANLSVTGFFTNLLTEDILFPKRKASGVLLLEILG
jgi:predicted RNA-binding protein